MNKPSHFPTPDQELLLKACLWDSDEALESWQTWRRCVALDNIDYASQRLLPLLYDNLRRMGVRDEQMPRYKGVYRHTWSDNQFKARNARRILDVFEVAGIPVLLSKGIAYSMLYYKSLSLRPMSDLDFLIPLEQVQPAIDILEKAGWNAVEFGIPRARIADHLLHRHAILFRDGSSNEVDLHWRLLQEGRQFDTDSDFWRHPQTIDFLGRPAQSMGDAEHLLHACAHGAHWNPMPPMRWVADAAMILRNGNVDWPWLLELVKRRRIYPFLQGTLSYLAKEMHCPVPADVLAALRRVPVQAWEQDEYRLKTIPFHELSLLQAPRLCYYHFRRSRAGIWGFARLLWYKRRKILSVLPGIRSLVARAGD